MDKTFDAGEAEPRIYADWEARGCFAAGANASRDGTFCIVIPPPNVTGSLHMGHALNNTLQDILVRWKRMQGYDVLWQPGTDHAGIATQMVVERALAAEGNTSRRDMGREAFVERVWQQKEQSEGTILGQLKRLGASCDWSRNRFTMDEGLSAAVLKVFVALYNEGLIYRDKRLVNWDPQFETAISDLEVEQVEEKGKLWRFRYPLAEGVTYEHPVKNEEGNVVRTETRGYVVVATTRPETMLGDSGVAVNPDDERYRGLVGKHVVLPLVNRRIPIVADEHADPEKGTGAVKITPAHDLNDFEVGRRHGLAQINVMTPRAAMHLAENADFLRDCDPEPECMMLHGLDRFEARKRVVRLADQGEWLDGIDDEMHVVPHGDRSKVPIEPYLTDQWFCDAKKLAGPAIEAVRDGTTGFVPENWARVYFNWMENIEPWCISRQLWWGHRIPVWYDVEGNAFCAMTQEEAAQQARSRYGVDVTIRFRDDLQIGLEPGERERAAPTSSAAGWVDQETGRIAEPIKTVTLARDPDVLDTWFSSALWPFSTLGWPDETPELARYYKTDVLVTGFDIIFFWVARMMMMGLHFRGEVPFHTVYINSIVVDAHGKKMSKSQGNVIDPLHLIDEYGADALRFTLAAQEVQGRRQLRLAVDQVQVGRNFGTKLWNAARFAEMNGAYEDHRDAPQPLEPRHTVNRWIIGETVRTAAAVDRALSALKFNEAAGALYDHVWKVFCDWYVEFAKPLLQGEDAAARAETRATMAWALDRCLVLLHPIMPFLTEALWGQLADREKLLVHAAWPELDAGALVDPQADVEIGWVIRLIEGVRSVRAELNVPPRAQIPMVLTGHSPAIGERLLRNAALIQRLATLSECAVADEAPSGSVTLALEDCAVSLELAGVIDIGAERARLEKSLGKARKDADGLERKLGNENFLAKAPKEVVEEQRERLSAARSEAAKLESALTRLAALA
jgi:valyl-tRNA synthetase